MAWKWCFRAYWSGWGSRDDAFGNRISLVEEQNVSGVCNINTATRCQVIGQHCGSFGVENSATELET